MSLDIPPINVTLILPQLFMSRMRKQIGRTGGFVQHRIALPGPVHQRNFPWTNQYFPPLLQAASHTDASIVKLDSPAKTDGALVLRVMANRYRVGSFLNRKRKRRNLPPKTSSSVHFFSRAFWLPKCLAIFPNPFSFSDSFPLSFEASFHSSDEKSSALVVLDYFSLRRRYFHEYSSKDSCSHRFFRGFC